MSFDPRPRSPFVMLDILKGILERCSKQTECWKSLLGKNLIHLKGDSDREKV